jgi:hypothetical protein
MKAIVSIILRIVKHPGILDLIMRILSALDSILDDEDTKNGA